jgi:hypothetical protein
MYWPECLKINRGIAMKQFCALLFLCSVLYGQDDYQKWLRKENDKFQTFLSEQDKKYYDFLKREWKEFKINDGIIRDKEPEPVSMPVAKPDVPKPEGDKRTEEIIDAAPNNPEPANKIIENNPSPKGIQHLIADQKTDYNYLDFANYEEEMTVTYPKSLKIELPGEISNQVIAEYWKRLNSIGLTDFMTFVQSKQQEFQLNDWGYFVYVWQLSNKIYSNEYNESLLLTWFVLLKSGYHVKVGLMDKSLMLFVKSSEEIFDVPYFKENSGQKTYIINFTGSGNGKGSLYTYDDDYPGASKYLSLKMDRSPILKPEPVIRKLEFSFDDKKYVLNIAVNKNLIDYYKDYPNTQYDTYFNADVSGEVKSMLIPALKEVTKGMKELEGVNFLLRFVQTAFGYKTDKENFGREKSLFVEETIFYPYSNCKDRAVLFAYLVKCVLNLKVVGVQYPGHMATAVALSGEFEGSVVMHNRVKYTICDPTYINADAGMSMPAHPVESIETIIDIK